MYKVLDMQIHLAGETLKFAGGNGYFPGWIIPRSKGERGIVTGQRCGMASGLSDLLGPKRAGLVRPFLHKQLPLNKLPTSVLS